MFCELGNPNKEPYADKTGDGGTFFISVHDRRRTHPMGA
jgi:hypothetical protein